MLSIQTAESTPAERYLVQSSLSGVIRVRGGNGGDGGNGHTRRHRETENGTRARSVSVAALTCLSRSTFQIHAPVRGLLAHYGVPARIGTMKLRGRVCFRLTLARAALIASPSTSCGNQRGQTLGEPLSLSRTVIRSAAVVKNTP